MPAPPPDTESRVERLLGHAATRWSAVARGYTQAERWVVELADGGSCFVKVGRSDHSRAALRKERRHLDHLEGTFAPRVIAWEDGEDPLIVLEDLSRAHWPPPWRAGDVARLLDALCDVARHPLPPGVGRASEIPDLNAGWRHVGEDTEPFLSLGFASADWLARALPVLIRAEADAPLDGDALCHLDLRSDNICFDDDRVVLVDWNGLRVGNPKLDIAALAPSLHFEGGPPPEDVVGHEPELAAVISGYFAWMAGLPPEDWPGFERIRRVQREQLSTALPWVARALGLPEPDGDPARAPLCIQLAAPDDADDIARIHVTGWQAAYRHIIPADKLHILDVARRARWWRGLIESPSFEGQRTWVALRHGVVCGFATAGHTRDEDGDRARVGELQAIYVAPDTWRTGTGTALFDTVIEYLRAQGFEEATVWVLTQNEIGRAFYTKHGWSPDGAATTEEWDGVEMDEVRYRMSLR